MNRRNFLRIGVLAGLSNIGIGKAIASTDLSKVFLNTNGHEYVDLGLPSGTLWATMNIGAEQPEDCGLYFAWGETNGYADSSERSFVWKNYKYANGSRYKLTKYCPSDNKYWLNYGFEGDTLTNLELSDDAARANWGGDWMMPTKEQFNELIENTSHVWDDMRCGHRLVGSNGNEVFFPAAGFLNHYGPLYDSLKVYKTLRGHEGYYWTSTLSEKYPVGVYGAYFFNGGILNSNIINCYGSFGREFGNTVRGVLNP